MRLQEKTLEKLRELINEKTEYRSGPVLVSFFNSLGFQDEYGQGFPSRWVYTDNRLAAINGTPQLDVCIKKVFSPVNFVNRYDELDGHIKEFNQYLAFDGYKVVRSAREVFVKEAGEIDDRIIEESSDEDKFLGREFSEIPLERLGLDSVITETLRLRFDEIKKCLSTKAPLAVIFLAGSSLEGILLGIASGSPTDAVPESVEIGR